MPALDYSSYYSGHDCICAFQTHGDNSRLVLQLQPKCTINKLRYKAAKNKLGRTRNNNVVLKGKQNLKKNMRERNLMTATLSVINKTIQHVYAKKNGLFFFQMHMFCVSLHPKIQMGQEINFHFNVIFFLLAFLFK